MNLAQFTSFYRRDSDEVLGAVRLSAVETISMEQMPGGRFQIIARTTAGGDGFVSCVMGTLREGQEMLEAMRRFLGGETGTNPAEAWLIARDEVDRNNEAADLEELLRIEAEAEAAKIDWTPPVFAE